MLYAPVPILIGCRAHFSGADFKCFLDHLLRFRRSGARDGASGGLTDTVPD